MSKTPEWLTRPVYTRDFKGTPDQYAEALAELDNLVYEAQYDELAMYDFHNLTWLMQYESQGYKPNIGDPLKFAVNRLWAAIEAVKYQSPLLPAHLVNYFENQLWTIKMILMEQEKRTWI